MDTSNQRSSFSRMSPNVSFSITSLFSDQIAERTGWNVRTVYNNLYEGIKALRAELNRTDPRLKFAAVFSILPIL